MILEQDGRISTTEIVLRGGSVSGAADLFELSLRWGDNEAIVPLVPGRRVHLSVLVYGGRRGFEDLGQVTIDRDRISIRLDADGGSLLDAPTTGVDQNDILQLQLQPRDVCSREENLDE